MLMFTSEKELCASLYRCGVGREREAVEAAAFQGVRRGDKARDGERGTTQPHGVQIHFLEY